MWPEGGTGERVRQAQGTERMRAPRVTCRQGPHRQHVSSRRTSSACHRRLQTRVCAAAVQVDQCPDLALHPVLPGRPHFPARGLPAPLEARSSGARDTGGTIPVPLRDTAHTPGDPSPSGLQSSSAQSPPEHSQRKWGARQPPPTPESGGVSSRHWTWPGTHATLGVRSFSATGRGRQGAP